MAHPGRDARSFQVLGIILDAMFLQKNSQLIDGCHLSMMFLLRFDVTPDFIPATGK
jgi:hypothetical protein